MYRRTIRRAALLLLVFAPARAPADAAPPEPLFQAHAHNDYLHERPLFDALDQQFGSVEVDIHLLDGELLVGHDKWQLRPERSLRSLYLDPLRERARGNNGYIFPGFRQPLTLLIDIKTDGAASYAALRDVLLEYDDLFPPPTDADGQPTESPAVIAIVSGNRPVEMIEQDNQRRVGIDGRVGDLDSTAPASLLPLISDNWRHHFSWRGGGPMPEAEREKLQEMVKQAHARGRRIRFWATPENEECWKVLREFGVDLIGTDNLPKLARFLRRH